jgi:hypothetical protein
MEASFKILVTLGGYHEAGLERTIQIEVQCSVALAAGGGREVEPRKTTEKSVGFF